MITLEISINSQEEHDLLGHFFNSQKALQKSKVKTLPDGDWLVKTSAWNFIKSKEIT